ncbi:hypothetical protein BGZ95_005113, partial [Linnemannia exigua]
MATATTSSSEASHSTYRLHSNKSTSASLTVQASPWKRDEDSSEITNDIATASPAEPRPPSPVRILQCGICLDDFEWFSLKNLVGYQEDPQDETTSSPLALLPWISKRPSFHNLCSHGRSHGTHSRQARIRWTSALFGGPAALQEEKKLKKVDADAAAAPLPPPSGLKLGFSLHNSKDHAFCMECLAKYIDAQVKARAWPITCPTEKC